MANDVELEDLPPPFLPDDEGSPPIYQNGHRLANQNQNSRRIQAMTSLTTSKGKPWFILKVQSRGTSTTLPCVVEGEPITGKIELDLEGTEHVEAITLKVLGEWVNTAGQNRVVEGFIDEPVEFYSEQITVCTLSNPKLKGRHEWPFSIALPEKFRPKKKDREDIATETAGYPLPPTFTERKSSSHLSYKLIVKLRKGKLRTDVVLRCPFIYLLQRKPPAPSYLRQLADSENSKLPGPEVDADGWQSLGIKYLNGMLFSSRPVYFSLLLYLAKPLFYTRGTFIPFRFEFDCADQQALDLLSLPKSFSITLARKVTIPYSRKEPESIQTSDHLVVTTRAGKGVYLFADDDDPTTSTRKMYGEIPLEPSLKPSFIFPCTSLEYMISLLIDAPGFSLGKDNKDKPIFAKDVEIASLLPPGIALRSRIPSN